MIDFSEIPRPDRAGLRQFGLAFGGMIALVFGLVIPWLFNGSYRTWPWLACAVFVAWALAHPGSLRGVYRGWMHVALVLGFINTRVIMLILFYGLFLPFGGVMRLFGWDAMHRRLDRSATSYRVPSQRRVRDHMSRPF